MKILIVTKQGALSLTDARTLKTDLEKLGYEVALAYRGPVSQPDDVRVEWLPQPEVGWFKKIFG